MLLDYEKEIWNSGRQVLGLDEAGYGCFGGSLYVAGVSFSSMDSIPASLKKVKDSKKLKEEVRFELEEEIKKHAQYWFCEKVTAEEINNSSNVYWLRFETAEKRIDTDDDLLKLITPGVVVYDGNKPLRLQIPGLSFTNIVKGDSKSFSIAAASILAKTAKDREMIELDKIYPEYEFAANKGYYSENHKNALLKYGMCPEHRHKYCRKYV